MYHNGILVANRYQLHTHHVVHSNPHRKLVFSSDQISRGSNFCNCEVDDLKIFEAALSPNGISELVNHN